MGCTKCNSGFVSASARCSKCGASFSLCNNCKGFWKSYACPSCKTNFANWSGL